MEETTYTDDDVVEASYPEDQPVTVVRGLVKCGPLEAESHLTPSFLRRHGVTHVAEISEVEGDDYCPLVTIYRVTVEGENSLAFDEVAA